jgi:glycosyltransferase involved in cell wall biosynthesis
MLVYSSYKSDARVKRYAETLVQRGDKVDVIALGRGDKGNHETINGVKLYKMQNRLPNEKGKLSFLFRIIKFLLNSSIFLINQHIKNPYQLIHVQYLPDFLVFAAFLPKLLGAKVILDIHDILPECYVTKFHKAQNGFTFKILTLLEKVSSGFSDHVIVSNHIWQKTLISRSIEKEKCTVILNYPDESVFYKRPRKRKDNKFIMIYPGSWIWHQGIDIAIKAFAIIKDEIPEAEFHIYGGGNDQDLLERVIFQLGLQNKVFLKGGLQISEIAEVIADADLGIEPKRNDGFADEALSTKIFEFMALGVPVIASDTKVHKYYFNDSVLKFFRAGDENSLAECMLLLVGDNDLRKRLVSNALEFVEGYIWEKEKEAYLNLVDLLTRNSRNQ